MSDRLLTARDVAELLAVSPESVLRWTRRGDLPALRLPGGAVRYRPDELDAWLEARSTDAAGRGSSDTRSDRARREAGYALWFAASDTRPPLAAATEEDQDAR